MLSQPVSKLAVWQLPSCKTLSSLIYNLQNKFLGALGYLFGAFFAWVCRQQRPQIVAISLETAIQNGGIAFVVMNLTFPSPYRSVCGDINKSLNTFMNDFSILYDIFSGTLAACQSFLTSCVQQHPF